MEFLKLDPEFVSDILQKFLLEEVKKAGYERVVFGLSGGVDSSVVAYLCARAFSPKQVTCLILPYRTSNPKNIEHAKLVVNRLKVTYEIRDISTMVDAFFVDEPEADVNRKGNRMARERMCVIYDYSSKYKAMVIGTSNKTELLLGYGTIFGDLASAINPIGDLYKTQIWQLAEYFSVPQEIIDKPPSADLWTGQTDEEEIGFTYQEIDRLLHYLVDLRYSHEMLAELNFPRGMAEKIINMIQKSQFKRRPPVIAKLSNRTINQDFRYCRDWGV
jgi:NAD+ synthase